MKNFKTIHFKIASIVLTIVLSHSVSFASLKSPDALMTPMEGEEGFSRMYDLIGNAKKYVFVSVYSWSDSGLEKSLEKALANKVKVKVVLHPTLKNSPKLDSVVPNLEAMGAEFKISPLNMHEKFILIDDETIVNTSANFSNGAKKRYSENIVFHELKKENTQSIKNILSDFKNEFVILWNTSKDIVTNNEQNADKMTGFTKQLNEPNLNSNIILFSSSMNWTLKDNAPTSTAYKAGKYQSLVKKNYSGSNEQRWTVRDITIKSIRNAKKSIYLSLNHFNIRVISDELIKAVERGIDVKLTVDNQEYKSKPNDLEMTPQFVLDWASLQGKREPPVRVKYYSHEPSPKNWLLNHHKFILIDYENPEDTVLLTGSYNFSKTAEHNQFDNLVLYKNSLYTNLYKSFYDEFNNQWNWNRENNVPNKEIVNMFFVTKNDSYPLHIPEAVSLSWSEIQSLRAKINQNAPGIFSGIGKNRDCNYYDPQKKEYWGCP
jgi:phosphatidylserine/phosphatidylglycerophosphate/cardiolipin synthase-like enzyme